MSVSSTFVCGRPVSGKEFINRENDLQTVFGRIRNVEPVAVVGEPHIGKTSLLHQMAKADIQRQYLGEDSGRFLFQFIDLHDIPANYTPIDFWEDITEPLEDLRDEDIRAALQRSREAGFDRRSVRRLFEKVRRKGYVLVPLLDEFDVLVYHPNFQGAPLFATIRSIQSNIQGLVPVVASRRKVSELNDAGSPHGSPYFNQMIDVILKPFDERAVGMLLAPGGFTEAQRSLIRVFAGRHPYLLQAMADTMQTCPQDLEKAAGMFYERTASHYHDIWKYLSEDQRFVALLLALMAFDGQARGQTFDYGEIEHASKFDRELRDLEEVGLAERLDEGSRFVWDSKHFLLWRGGRWRIGSLAFAWWLRDHVITQHEPLPEIDDFLRRKRYRLFLTQEQWDTLRESAHSVAPNLISLAKLVLKSMGRKRK